MTMLERINELLDHDESFCLASILTSNNPQIKPGRQMIIPQSGAIEGGTGDTRLDEGLVKNGLECFNRNRKISVEIEPGMLVFFDLIAKSIRLIICGAGHIALPLARYARDVGFGVTVIDDREDFASPGRFPGCKTIVGDFTSVLRDMSFGPSTYAVVITRGHEHDTDCLLEILKHEIGYVGLIGSRRRIGFVLELLGEQGIPQHRISNIFTPIGLPIGADSPEEIAVSIVAELVCIRKKGAESTKMYRNVMDT